MSGRKKQSKDGQRKTSEVTSDGKAKPKRKPKRKKPANNRKTEAKHQKELAENEIFAGDKKFQENLNASEQPFTSPVPPENEKQQITQNSKQSIPAGIRLLPGRLSKLSIIQKCLLGLIAAISIILIYSFILWLPGEETEQPISSKGKNNYADNIPESRPETTQKLVRKDIDNPPLSLRMARELYHKKDFPMAYKVYERLLRNLPDSDSSVLMKDYLKLQMALSKTAELKQQALKKTTTESTIKDKALNLFRTIAFSRSPAIRILANYYLAINSLEQKQFLKARTRAYRTLALLDLMDEGNEWTRKIRNDCLFFVPETLTRKVLSLSDADKDIPEDLWEIRTEVIDPFDGLNENRIHSLLKKGIKELKTEMLGPKITTVKENSKNPPQSKWSVISFRASVEELLARFASNAHLDLSWKINGEGESKAAIRKRPVTLFIEQAASGPLVSTALGSTGLLGEIENNSQISVYNPADYVSLSDYISLLSRKALSLWQSFMLILHNDSRVTNAHFAVALLQNIKGNRYDAVAEFKLIANRYPESRLIPFALLHSSRIKTELHDYTGASDDLEQLIQRYPECELSERACLNLADVHMEAGLHSRAGGLYQKVYKITASRSSQARASLGAGKCFYLQKSYEAAQKWLNRYIKLTNQAHDDNLYSAYFLLGKTYLALDKAEPAARMLKSALAGNLSQQECVRIISTLVDALSREQKYVEALDVLEKVESRPLSREAAVKMLLLRVELLRKMGLVERAVSILSSRVEYVTNPDLKAGISFELAKAHIAKADLDSARSLLSEAVTVAESQNLAHKIALTLADVCLRLKQTRQSISISRQILNSNPSTAIKKKTLNKMAEAYESQKDYNRAALTLMGHWRHQEKNQMDQSLEEPIAKDSISKKQK